MAVLDFNKQNLIQLQVIIQVNHLLPEKRRESKKHQKHYLSLLKSLILINKISAK